jgi:DNA-binding protein HU-beta
MKKSEIVTEIVNKTGIDKVVVLGVVESFMDTIKKSMINGENIYMRGFGSFVLKKRADKLGRNITRNTTVKIPAHMIPVIKFCDEFVEEVKTKVKIK